MKCKRYTAVAILSLLNLFGVHEAQSSETALLPSEFVIQHEYATETSALFASLLEAGVTGTPLSNAQMAANAAASQLQFLFDPLILGEPAAGYPMALSPLGPEKTLIANSLLGDIEYRTNALNAAILSRTNRVQIGFPLNQARFDTKNSLISTYTIENSSGNPMRAYLGGVELARSPFSSGDSFIISVDKAVTFQAYAASAVPVINFSSVRVPNGIPLQEISPDSPAPYVFFNPSTNTFSIVSPSSTIAVENFATETLNVVPSFEFIFYNNTPEPIEVTVGTNAIILESGVVNPNSSQAIGSFPIADGDRITGSNSRVFFDLTLRLPSTTTSMELINNGSSSGVFWGLPNLFFLQ